MRTMIAAALGALLLPSPASAGEGKVKVFILAGQSNMEGKAKMELLERQAGQDSFKHLRRDGAWVVRDDVWIKFLDRKGRLTVGFGSPNCVGPELEFGTAVGDHYPEPVLLIKTAWGGRSLYRDFRPPSSGLPAAEVLEKMLADQRKRKPEATLEDVKAPFGASYRAMLEEVNSTLANLKTLFPDLPAEGAELAGFIWFHGWNDMINDDYTAEYTKNLANLVRDVRKDLKAQGLPFVVGQMGVDGTEANAKVQKFKAAQAAAGDLPEFKGNLEVVKTDVFWDTEAHAVFKKGWKQNLEEWKTVGSDFPYHYLGSAKTYGRIGRALGESVLRLRGGK